jgi:AraC family transcriptional regulator
MFHLPRTALDAMASETGAPRLGDLRHRPGVSVDDPVVRHLLSSLLPVMKEPERANSLFLDHVVRAMTAHLACQYAGMNPSPGILGADWRHGRSGE